MNLLKRKKKKDPEDLDLKDDNIIDFDEFEEFEEELKKEGKDSVDPLEVAKHFIFHIENGCPICGGDVKGNEYFRFFCKHCNVLFEKKDIIEQEFGKSIADTIGPVRKTKLTEEESEALAEKRKALSDRIYKTFSEEQRQELIEEAEEERAEEEADEEDEPVEEQEPEEIEEVIDEEPEEPEEEPEETAPAHRPMEHILEAEYEDADTEEHPEDETEEADDDEDEHEQEPEQVEYELEEEGKIIASSESDKLHKGNCHFVKKINPENRIYFDSIEQGEEEGYGLCVCLRRLKAMQR